MDGFFFVVARDFGFAPNPFHGVCTLATCKPVLRRVAQCGDWIFGVGGAGLGATGRLIFAMEVGEALTFGDYWDDPRFLAKRPVRNGSRKMLVGDNIYHPHPDTGEWIQEDSHHSHPDGTPNEANVRHDTKTDRVLIGHPFYYFGREAPEIPPSLLNALGYSNGRNHRRYPLEDCEGVLNWVREEYGGKMNYVVGDPHDFGSSERRYSLDGDKVT